MNPQETLKRLRKEKGYTQQKLAQKTYVSQQSISSIERGTCNPSIETFELLLKELGYELILRRKL